MILVLGTGRSGTSEVARALDELGVNMGNAFHMGDKFNPKGYFEDREFQALNLSFYMMHLDTTEQEMPWQLWREQFEKLIAKREEPWGLKDPGIADFPKLLDEYLKLNPRIIHTVRDKEDTIASLMRFKGKDREEMERIYNNRWENNKKALKGDYLEIECYQPYEDKKNKIEAWLSKK